MRILWAVVLLVCSCANPGRPASAVATAPEAYQARRPRPQRILGQWIKTPPPAMADGAPLAIDDFTVIDVHGKVCYMPGSSLDDIRYQLGQPLSDEPAFPDAYNDYLSLSYDDYKRVGYINEFVCRYDGLYCEYYDKYGLIYIFHITGSRFRTLRGLTIGDTMAKVIRLYGPPDLENDFDRKDHFTWLPDGYAKPWKILTYDVDVSAPMPGHQYFGPGATYHIFLDEQDRVELIYATGED